MYTIELKGHILKGLFLLSLFSMAAFSSELKIAYICSFEGSTGFLYDQSKWKSTQFTEKDFLIRKFRDDDNVYKNEDKRPYGVFELDEKIPAMYCSIDGEALKCSGLGELKFLSTTGRFIRTDTNAYIGGDEYPSLQAKITIGTCKPLPADYKELPKKFHPKS